VADREGGREQADADPQGLAEGVAVGLAAATPRPASRRSRLKNPMMGTRNSNWTASPPARERRAKRAMSISGWPPCDAVRRCRAQNTASTTSPAMMTGYAQAGHLLPADAAISG
jgi:hypothetical protein